MENATKLIAELRDKVRRFEERMLQPEENRMEVDQVQGSEHSSGRHDIGINAMREQIKFMAEKLVQTRAEIEEKEVIVKQVEMDKRHFQRKFENAEIQISQLREEVQQLKQSKQVIGQKSVLESDGLQLFDLKAEDFEDLRESLAPENRPLALMIESVSKERDMLRLKVESMQREHLNQTLGKCFET